MADFGATELDAFRQPRRGPGWRRTSRPRCAATRTRSTEAMMAGRKPTGDVDLWRQRMGEKGWGVPTWPNAYGGGGLSPAEARVLQRGDGAHRRVQPDRRHGRHHVRPDAAGIRHRGAEAASTSRRSSAARCAGARATPSRAPAPTSPRLQTKAEDKGDHWLINGQKIWTSGAQYADWCFCLVRTDPKAKKHEGISFLLIDMQPAGRRDAADPADQRRHRRSARPSSPTRRCRRRTWSGR